MLAWQITRKDLYLLARDRRTLTVLVVLPMIFITIIGLTTGQLLGWHDNNKTLRILYVDDVNYDAIRRGQKGRTRAEERAYARNIVVKIHNNLQKRRGIELREVSDVETARELYLSGEANCALIIGPDFYEKFGELESRDVIDSFGGRLQGDLGNLDITLEGEDNSGSTFEIVDTIVYGIITQTISPHVVCDNRTGDTATRAQLKTACADLDREAQTVIEPLPPQKPEKTDQRVYQVVIPSYTVLFAFFLVNIMARSFIQERELGTLRRLRLAPIQPFALLSGKTLPFLIVSLVQTVLLFICGKLLFKMDWGEAPLLLLPVIFCTSMAATSLGLMIAALVRTDSQVSAYANAVVIIFGGISGCFMPRDMLPAAMQKVSLATPHAWALIAFGQLLTDDRPEFSLWICCVALLAFATCFFAVGAWRFRTIE